ncbi:ROS/MUCR transcriptional regulator protein [Geodermatophilus sabuli]|uniref:ROS/MUCR transcriptional regulator protein n=1 Tax=Geodermatophilus sabuli TaxID=1564158 RepID=A0A285EC08_9ACTN|nr:ROS/MUCR transcriptional regulator protein [Geodermatophilus sabuli]
MPVARLPDGSPVFAPPGVLVVADGGRRMVCHACGDLLTHISPAHLRRHGMDGQSYRRRYGLPSRRSLAAPGLRSARAEEGRRRYTGNADLRAGLEHGQRRTDRLAEQRLARVRALGFITVDEYLRQRYVEEGWSVHLIGAELRTGRRVLPRLMDAAGVRRSRPGGPGHRGATGR